MGLPGNLGTSKKILCSLEHDEGFIFSLES